MARSTNRKLPEQLTLDSVRYHSGRGGPRHGAGRPRGIRPRVMHRYRERILARVPVHVTIRFGAESHLTATPLRATVPLLLERGLRPARLLGGALLDSARSPAPADRSPKQLLDRLRNEECRRPHRQAYEPALPAQGQSARRTLSLASTAHAARGPPCPALCAAQSPASRRAAAQTQPSSRPRDESNPIPPVPAARSTAGVSPPSLRTLQTSAKSPLPEPGYCEPPGVTTDSSIQRTLRESGPKASFGTSRSRSNAAA